MKRTMSIFILILTILNISMNYYYKKSIHQTLESIPQAQAALVLGAGIRKNKPSPILRKRLQGAIDLYRVKKVHKILLSGDNTKKFYHEVNVMKNYLLKNKIPSKDILADLHGVSTLNSVYNCKNIFKIKKVIIVTQIFHLSRAIFLAEQVSLNAVGYANDSKDNKSNFYILLREFFARYLALYDAILIWIKHIPGFSNIVV